VKINVKIIVHLFSLLTQLVKLLLSQSLSCGMWLEVLFLSVASSSLCQLLCVFNYLVSPWKYMIY